MLADEIQLRVVSSKETAEKWFQEQLANGLVDEEDVTYDNLLRIPLPAQAGTPLYLVVTQVSDTPFPYVDSISTKSAKGSIKLTIDGDWVAYQPKG